MTRSWADRAARGGQQRRPTKATSTAARPAAARFAASRRASGRSGAESAARRAYAGGSTDADGCSEPALALRKWAFGDVGGDEDPHGPFQQRCASLLMQNIVDRAEYDDGPDRRASEAHRDRRLRRSGAGGGASCRAASADGYIPAPRCRLTGLRARVRVLIGVCCASRKQARPGRDPWRTGRARSETEARGRSLHCTARVLGRVGVPARASESINPCSTTLFVSFFRGSLSDAGPRPRWRLRRRAGIWQAWRVRWRIRWSCRRNSAKLRGHAFPTTTRGPTLARLAVFADFSVSRCLGSLPQTLQKAPAARTNDEIALIEERTKCIKILEILGAYPE